MAGLFALVLGVIALARGRVGWARLGNRAAGGVVIGAALALLTIGAVAAPPAAPSSTGLPLTSRAAAPTTDAAAEKTAGKSAAAEAAAAADKAAADATADAAAATAKAASDAAAKTARDAAAKQAQAAAAASAKAQAAAQAQAAAASAKAKAAAQAKARATASAPPPPPAATSYDNCTDMHADYKGGVALPGAVDHRTSGGHANFAPVYSRSLYEANSGSDRDGDGIACEA